MHPKLKCSGKIMRTWSLIHPNNKAKYLRSCSDIILSDKEIDARMWRQWYLYHFMCKFHVTSALKFHASCHLNTFSTLHYLTIITADFWELGNMEDASFYDSSVGAFIGTHTSQAIHYKIRCYTSRIWLLRQTCSWPWGGANFASNICCTLKGWIMSSQ